MERTTPFNLNDLVAAIGRDGFAILPRAFGAAQLGELSTELDSVLETPASGESSILTSRGAVYAARNLLQVWPRSGELAREPALVEAVQAVLGAGFGLVRALYFDKPPERSWSLPWHKDMTIAVRDNRRPSRHFSKPTTKQQVPHVEAPESVLERMLTARIHLDSVTDENGPLIVVAGSHRTGKLLEHVPSGDSRLRTIFASAGDVLLMRPLVAHSSGNSRAGTRRHRRIVHLEFASAAPLPDGYDWHDFKPIAED